MILNEMRLGELRDAFPEMQHSRNDRRFRPCEGNERRIYSAFFAEEHAALPPIPAAFEFSCHAARRLQHDSPKRKLRSKNRTRRADAMPLAKGERVHSARGSDSMSVATTRLLQF